MKSIYFFIILLQIFIAASGRYDPAKWQHKSIQKIVNGVKAKYKDNPSMGALLWKNQHICGCSIIDHYHMLTAAHCITGSADQYKVVTGAINIKEYDNDAYSSEYNVSKVMVHEGYSAVEYGHDIAMLRTNKPIEYVPNYVLPAKLPQPGEDYCDSATVWGWGATSDGGYSSNYLLKVDVPPVSFKTCQAKYAKEGYTIYKDSQICYGYEYGGKDSCTGDSGGPLTCQQSPYYQLGVVSYGIGCAEARYPGVYTRVSAYYDWINKKRHAYGTYYI